MVAQARADLETKVCAAAAVLRMAGGALESDNVQKIQVLSDAGTCLKPHPQWPPSSVLDACSTVTPF